jgi:hypothetical protein
MKRLRNIHPGEILLEEFLKPSRPGWCFPPPTDEAATHTILKTHNRSVAGENTNINHG